MFVQQLDAVDGRMPFRAGEGRMPRSRNLDRRIALHSQGGSEPSDEVAILRNRVGEVSVVHAKHGSERTFASVPNEGSGLQPDRPDGQWLRTWADRGLGVHEVDSTQNGGSPGHADLR